MTETGRTSTSRDSVVLEMHTRETPVSAAVGSANGGEATNSVGGLKGEGPREPGITPPAQSPGIMRNVLANWIGHCVAIVSGFVVPRLINDSLGDVRLGVWDFGWSVVAYMSLLTAGITSSTNRYTARYRATGDWDQMNRAVSACLTIFMFTCALAIILTVGVVAAAPSLLGESLQGHISEARWLLLLLGITAAIQMPLSVPSGVITGCQRYDFVNIVEGLCYFVTIAGVAISLLAGGGLFVLGVVVLTSESLAGAAKYIMAHRVCPQLVLSPRRATWSAIKEVTMFGWKVFLERTSRIVLYQTNSMLIIFWLGPASLAVYARSQALVLQAQKLLYHYGRVFTPVASSMQARDDERGLADLLCTSAQRALLIALPIVLGLVLVGHSLLEVWMGADFAVAWVLPLLAIGHLSAMMQTPAYHILLGVDRHGKAGVASLILAVVGVGISALLIGVWNAGIVGAAVGVATAVSILNVVVVPMLAVRSTQLKFGTYLRRAVPIPLLANLPLAITLWIIRDFVDASAMTRLLLAVACGAPALLIPYSFVVPKNIRRRITSPFFKIFKRRKSKV